MPLFHRRAAEVALSYRYHRFYLPDTTTTPLLTMFGGFAPPQQSPEEIRAMEAEAVFTVQQVVAAAFMLYLSPFAIDMASRVF
ncbi:hypothetical protein E4U49_004473 [Claviceps purpurea]|nr:hypothetical protein E4U49_004473 [Claviceps purpurea]